MFINLRKALDRRCISLREYADFLGISEAAVQDKLEGGKDFTYWEFRRTRDLLLPEYNADFLFAETILENRSA